MMATVCLVTERIDMGKYDDGKEKMNVKREREGGDVPFGAYAAGRKPEDALGQISICDAVSS